MNLTQSDIEQLNQFERFLSFKPTWVFKRFIYMPDDYIFLCTGNQCLAAEEMIYDPVLNQSKRIDEIQGPFHVNAWDGEKTVIAKASEPFVTGYDKLYQVNLSNGESFLASGQHRILLDSGWRRLSECVVGSSAFLPPSISDSGLLNFLKGALRSTKTTPDSQCDCQECHHLCDEQLPWGEDICQDAFPLQGDAAKHSSALTSLGGLACKDNDTLQLLPCRPSNQGDLPRSADPCAETQSHISCKDHKGTCVFRENRACGQSLCGSIPQPQCSVSSHQSSRVGDDSYKPPKLNGNSIQVTSIYYVRDDVKWDFEVEGLHNYIHKGIVHHNCGKTAMAAYQYVLRILGKHPIPKKNLMYFECPQRAAALELSNSTNVPYVSPHGWYNRKYKFEDGTIVTVPSWEKGTWSLLDKPKDDKCPYCGEDIIIHKRASKVFRFCSQTLPGDKETLEGTDGASAEVKNTVYPEFKKWLPPLLIKKDITFRSYAMIIKDPYAGHNLLRDEIYRGSDSVVEFVSYSMNVQSTAGSQKCSIWVDEESPKDFWEEQIPRLFAEDGDIVLSLTPANKISWTFDGLFERANTYIRSKAVCEALSTEDNVLKMGETTDNDSGIGVIQASSYDNPTLSNEVIERMTENIDDPDVRLTRLYGVHKQASGRVFKDFDYRIHVIDPDHYFPEGLYPSWRYARMIDYHEKNPWACTWVTLSPWNEMFVFEEFNPSPEKMVTREISHQIADLSSYFKYSIDLIDPLANKVQSNTGTTVVQDLNQFMREFKKNDTYPGFKGGYFEPWDTKSTRGRDEIRRRLKWAKECRVPFNNKVSNQGLDRYVPTLWVFKNCKEMSASLKQWRYEEYSDRQALVNKDSNEKVTQKFSHFCMCLEAILKDVRFRPKQNIEVNIPKPRYFQGRVA